MNNKNMKRLIYRIIKEEIKENNVDVEVLPLTSLENIITILKSSFQQQPKTLTELIIILQEIKDELYINRKTEAYYNYESNQLKILLKRNKHQDESYLIWLLIRNIYHEYKHALLTKLVKKSTITTTEDLIYAIENLINAASDFYMNYHDDFYEEILANIYGVKKAEQYLKNKLHFKKIYRQLINIIELEKLNHETYYRNYDLQLILEEVNKEVKANIREMNTYPDDNSLEIVRILYKKNGKFKTLTELSQTPKWHQMTLEAKYQIVSSPAYLKDINYKTISTEELYFILDALSYVLTLETERPKYNQEIRKKLELISRTLNQDNLMEQNIYLDTLLILNTKEESNTIKIERLKKLITTIITILKERDTIKARRVLQKK